MKIKIRKHNINKKGIWLFFLFLFMFEPKLFVKYRITNAIYIAGAVLCFLIMLHHQVMRSKKASKMLLICMAYRLSFGIQTFLSNGDILMWGYMSIIVATLCMAIDYYSTKSPRLLLSSIVYVLMIILTINLVISFIYPLGVIDEIYFIGIRTRFTDVIFVLAALTLMLDRVDQKIITTRTIYCLALCIIHIVRFWIATAVLGLFVFVISYILLLKKKYHFKVLNINFVLLTSLIASILLVMTDVIGAFSWLIEGILGKSLTLSGRTLLWEASRRYILQSPIFGHGMAIDGNFIPSFYRGANVLRQAHNQWVQIMYESGIVGTALFAWSISLSKKPTSENLFSSREGLPICASLIAFLIMMLAEIYSYNPYIYVLIFIAYFIKRFELNKG